MIGSGENSMLRRALPMSHPEIAFGEDHAADRRISAGAILHALADWLARMLRGAGAFFAAGGALS
jgi:hypothetical protein